MIKIVEFGKFVAIEFTKISGVMTLIHFSLHAQLNIVMDASRKLMLNVVGSSQMKMEDFYK